MKHFLLGVFFIIFDLNLPFGEGRIGLLPGFVGFALLWYGARNFSVQSRHFQRMQTPALCLCLCSLIGYVMTLMGAVLDNPWLAVPVSLAIFIASWYVLYQMTQGITQLEYQCGEEINAQKLDSWLQYMMVTQLISIFTVFILIMFVLAAIAYLIFCIGFFVQMYRCYRATQCLSQPLGTAPMQEDESV